MLRISSFQATKLAWKSTECGSLFVSGFFSVMRTVSPTLTRRTGPGTESPNVQTDCTMPGATVIVVSLTTRSSLCRVPAASGGAAGSRGEYSGAFGSGSMVGFAAEDGDPLAF